MPKNGDERKVLNRCSNEKSELNADKPWLFLKGRMLSSMPKAQFSTDPISPLPRHQAEHFSGYCRPPAQSLFLHWLLICLAETIADKG